MDKQAESTLLHITDGESVAGTLRQSTVPGDVKIYGDLLYEGPAPAGLNTETWLETRAGFLAENGIDFDAARQYLTRFEATLDAVSQYDETVLWLDHRLSDQLILIKLLHRFSHQHLYPKKLSLICLDRYPGIDYFIGLGQLKADQLASLLHTRLPVTQEQLRLGQLAWNAFTSPDPTTVESVLRSDTSALPFLAAALKRHLEQFPSTDNGLSRTEEQTLLVLRKKPSTVRQLFRAVQNTESPLFMGDRSFFRLLADLAKAPHPLIRTVDDSPFDPHLYPTTPVTISDTGLRIVENQEDHIQLNGINRWLGGVHLKGRESAWQWNPLNEQLVAQ